MDGKLRNSLISLIQVNEEIKNVEKKAAEAVRNEIQPLLTEDVSCSLFSSADGGVTIRIEVERQPLSNDDVCINMKTLKEISSILEADDMSIIGGSYKIIITATTNVVPY